MTRKRELRCFLNLMRSTYQLMAYKVIDGKYGNGEERKSKLGMYYDIIQDRVDEILR